MFGSIAPTYDLLNHVLSLSFDRCWRRTTARLALENLSERRNPARKSRWAEPGNFPAVEDCPTTLVLDVATGTGDLALEFARRLETGKGSVVGVDFSGPMLQIARRKLSRRAGYPVSPGGSVTLSEADAHALPFADDSFDVVSVGFGLRNMKHPDRALREMTRVVRPGGCVAVLEFSEPPNRLFRFVFRLYFHRILPLVGGAVSRSDAYRYLPNSVEVFWTMREFRQRMRAAGLDSICSWLLSGGIAGLHIGRKSLVSASGLTSGSPPRRRDDISSAPLPNSTPFHGGIGRQ